MRLRFILSETCDMETEAEIQRHLRELDEQKTIVTIAHRISSVKDSDL